MGERRILEHIASLSAGAPTALAGGWSTAVGPGDDCAVLTSSAGALLLTVDQLVEGRHFEPGTDLDLIARKAVARSISDIAAMGGTPSWALATGLIPDGDARGEALSEALHRWSRHWGASMVGGDIAFGPGPLALTVTVGGVMEKQSTPLLRSAARAGHSVYVSGSVGNSFESGWHLNFEPRLALGRVLAADVDAGAAIDVSDGLGLGAHRVGEASGVVLAIEGDRVPRRDPERSWHRSVADGEDYELLFTHESPDLPSEIAGTRVTRIGSVREVDQGGSAGAVLSDSNGEVEGSTMGWSHGEQNS